jgi:hypothetical protein
MNPGIAAFLGPAPRGPLDRPTPVTRYEDFVTAYGEDALPHAPGDNHLALALRLFFANGGTHALVQRVGTPGTAQLALPIAGHALLAPTPLRIGFAVRRRRPIATDKLLPTMLLEAGPPRRPRVVAGATGPLRVVLEGGRKPRLLRSDGQGEDGPVLQQLLLEVLVGEGDSALRLRNLSTHPDSPGWIGTALDEAAIPLRLVTAELPDDPRGRARYALTLLRALLALGAGELAAGAAAPPGAADYAAALARLDDPAIEFLVAPAAATLPAPLAQAIDAALVADALARHRFALLAAPPGGEVAASRAAASPNAALYAPWLLVATAAGSIATPPVGAIAGLLCRIAAREGRHHAGAGRSLAASLGLASPPDATWADRAALHGINPLVMRDGAVLLRGAATAGRDRSWPHLPARQRACSARTAVSSSTPSLPCASAPPSRPRCSPACRRSAC